MTDIQNCTMWIFSSDMHKVVSDVLEKTSTLNPCIIFEKIMMHPREDGGVIVDKKCKKSTIFQ